MNDIEPVKTDVKPDYARIILVGIPLSVFCWFFIIIIFAFLTNVRQGLFPLSVGLTAVLFIVYFILAVKYPRGLGGVTFDERAKTKKTHAWKPLSNASLAFTGVMVVVMIGVAFVGEIFFQMDGMKALRTVWPIWIVFAVMERKIKKTKDRETDTEDEG